MSELTIRTVDPQVDADIEDWQRLVESVMSHEMGEHAVVWTAHELMVSLRSDRRHREMVLTVGAVDGRVVAAGDVELPLLDNLTSAEVGVWIAPEMRGRGFGAQMLEHVEAIAAERDRTRLDMFVEYPYEGPADGSGVPGIEFGKKHGYAYGLGDVQRELALPVDDALLAGLLAEAAPYHQGYEIRAWSGSVPDDLVVSWLELSSTLEVEAPTGDNEREAGAVDVDAYRRMEAVIAKQGRTKWNAAALDPEGRVVAYTDMAVTGSDQPWVFQWGTLVHRDHRGHRLGMAVKAANLKGVQDSGIDLTGKRVVTWNAEVNDHMIGINERLGFVKAGRTGELQKKA